jgi:hypothetical protein
MEKRKKGKIKLNVIGKLSEVPIVKKQKIKLKVVNKPKKMIKVKSSDMKTKPKLKFEEEPKKTKKMDTRSLIGMGMTLQREKDYEKIDWKTKPVSYIKQMMEKLSLESFKGNKQKLIEMIESKFDKKEIMKAHVSLMEKAFREKKD